MRPSSLQRIARIDALIAELSLRQLGNLGAAALLDCSASSARNYLRELLDAGVIVTGFKPMPACADKTVYRLSGDHLRVTAFQAALAAERCGARAGAGRDPLVAALFGAPRAGDDRCGPARS
ncbi:MAG: hypothetical protein ABWY27_09620 [Telluria sp.]